MVGAEERPCEDTARMQPAASHREKKPNLLTP